ncbi:MAG: hypothetical protein K0R61_4757 [Microvirga sp.]|nr:hypothetical protein [Microvirga sp.]
MSGAAACHLYFGEAAPTRKPKAPPSPAPMKVALTTSELWGEQSLHPIGNALSSHSFAIPVRDRGRGVDPGDGRH